MSLADYISKNYLSADSKPSKKRKRKEVAMPEGLVIEDDDSNNVWRNSAVIKGNGDDDAPTIVGGTLAGGLNKPAKKSKWVKIGADAPTDAEQAAADAILADARAESHARAQQDDDDPAVVDEDGMEYNGPTMTSGALAGLQTAEQVAAAMKRKERAERKAMRAAGLDSGGLAQQTIYRDASGRMINVKEKRDEAESKAQEEARQQKEELENRKGDVQRREKEERRKELEEARVMTVARHADDKQLNEELKRRDRWNDPMAPLLASQKQQKNGGSSGGRSKGGSSKIYQGASEPNRYGIRPGWRWDGVDRSNGFERKWFHARNKQRDKESLQYHWEMDE